MSPRSRRHRRFVIRRNTSRTSWQNSLREQRAKQLAARYPEYHRKHRKWLNAAMRCTVFVLFRHCQKFRSVAYLDSTKIPSYFVSIDEVIALADQFVGDATAAADQLVDELDRPHHRSNDFADALAWAFRTC